MSHCADAVLYGCAPLYLPTAVRGSGIGTASALGRMICKPYIAFSDLQADENC